MSLRFVSNTQIVSTGGNNWLIAQLRQSFDKKNSQQIEDFAKKESFTHACVYQKDSSLIAAYINNAPVNAFFIGENFAKYVLKTNGSKNAICLESYSADDWLLVVVFDGEIVVEKRLTKIEVLSTIADVIKSKNERDEFYESKNPGQYSKTVFSLYCYGVNAEDFTVETTDLLDALSFLCDIEDVRSNIHNQSIFATLDKEPAYPVERTKLAVSHIRDEGGGKGSSILPIIVIILALVGFSFFYFSGEEEEEVKVNPYESYYSSVKTKYLNIYPRLVSDYNLLILLEKEVPNWAVSTMTLDKGFTAFKLVPIRSEAKVAELRAFSEKYKVQFDSDTMGYSILSPAENYTVFGNKYRKIFSVTDVHQYLDDAFVEAIPSTQLVFVKDVPNGIAPSMQWTVRELNLNLTDTSFEDFLSIGGVVVTNGSQPLPVFLGGDELTGTPIGTLSVDMKTRTVTGTMIISVFGKRN